MTDRTQRRVEALEVRVATLETRLIGTAAEHSIASQLHVVLDERCVPRDGPGGHTLDLVQRVMWVWEQEHGATEAGAEHSVARELAICRRQLCTVEDELRVARENIAALTETPLTETPAPVPIILSFPQCHARHIDRGEFATKHHHTHSCQACGACWRPAVVATVGVQYLPGFKDLEP